MCLEPLRCQAEQPGVLPEVALVLTHHDSRVHGQHPIRVREDRVQVQFLDLRVRFDEVGELQDQALERRDICRRLTAYTFQYRESP